MVRIKELEFGCDCSYLEVRILRKWTPHFRNKETWFLAIDKEGDTIAILGQQQGQNFLESRLKIGKCYGIEQYSCSETPANKRTIRNTVHLNAGEASHITPIEDRKEIPELSFDFAAMNDLHAFLPAPAYFPDFIGRHKRQGFSNKKNGDRFLILTLTSMTGQEITITMWKECIENIEKVNLPALSAATAETIIAITNVKPAVYADILKLSSTDATHVYLNPTLPAELTEHGQSSAADQTIQSTTSYTVMTLAELQDKMYDNLQRKTIAVDARIVDTRFDHCWYVAIRGHCKSQISKLKDAWFCPNHGKNCNASFFYNINATLSDGTTNLEVSCTDLCVQKLMGRTCKEIVMKEGYEDRKMLHPSFKKQGMTTYMYHIEMSRKSTPTNTKFVIVNKEAVPTESATSQDIMPVSHQTDPLTAITETTVTTTPPESQQTPTTETRPADKNIPTPQQHQKPTAAKRLAFEPTDIADTVHMSIHLDENPIDAPKQTKDYSRKAPKDRKLINTGKRKITSQSDEPISHKTNTSTVITEKVHTITPPHTPLTLPIEPESSKPTDSEDHPVNNPEETSDEDQTTTKNTKDSATSKRKTASPSDELEIINPGKRERFPE